MRGIVWLFAVVFIVGVVYPPAAAAIACAAGTGAFAVWFLLWFVSRRD